MVYEVGLKIVGLRIELFDKWGDKMKYIKHGSELTKEERKQIGGKASALLDLAQGSFNIPEWVVVLPSAFEATKNLEQRELFEQEVRETISALGGDDRYAVRSSALSEDGIATSFAGQFETYLWVDAKDVVAAVYKVWESGFSERVKAYKEQRMLGGEVEVPAVIIQRMVCSSAAGVAFAVNPTNGDIKTAIVSAVFGLGSALVDGACDADVYEVDQKGQVLSKVFGEKEIKHGIEEGELKTIETPNQKDKVVLQDSEIQAVASLARKASRHFNKYQDIEWAFEGGQLYLLQSRPITTLGLTLEEQGTVGVFDNSNIAESYIGTTMPLTFSFIRKAYAEVYRQFCRNFGVSETIIQKETQIFDNMLGFVDHRVYYNLVSWYRLLAILPGYQFNKKFMEQMMGVKGELPEAFLKSIETPEAKGLDRTKDLLRLIKTGFKMLGEYRRLEKSIRKFYIRLDESLEKVDVQNMRLDELYSYYKLLEKKLMTKWDAPLANDFFCMIGHGLLRSLSKKWLEDESLANQFLIGQGDIISAKPAEMIGQMGAYVREKALGKLFLEGSLQTIEIEIERLPELRKQINEYLTTFSDRCLDELKLESRTVADDPLVLYRAIGANSMNVRRVESYDLNQMIEEKVNSKLKGLKRRRYIKVLKAARRLVRNRENLRFERTRLFGRVRQIFLEIGMRWASTGLIDNQEDIFYLEVSEILGVIDHTATSYNLKELVAVRKLDYERDTLKDDPPRRFMVKGCFGSSKRIDDFNETIHDELTKDMKNGEIERGKRQKGEQNSLEQLNILTGLGCSAGIVEGYARVVLNPKESGLQFGEILIARQTDPGWILLFNMAAGVVVERGSLLSHAAIISRELGLPAVVSVEQVTTRIQDGDYIRLDGARGTVEILKRNEE